MLSTTWLSQLDGNEGKGDKWRRLYITQDAEVAAQVGERNHQGLENRLIKPGEEVGQTEGEVRSREYLSRTQFLNLLTPDIQTQFPGAAHVESTFGKGPGLLFDRLRP